MYKHLTIFDRQTIEIQLKRWASQKEIAIILNKSKSCISREINRNSVKKKWTNKKIYLAAEAHLKAYQRRRRAKTQSMKINLNLDMKFFIIKELKRKDKMMSPKSIADKWNKDNNTKITHTSIYSWLETGIWNEYKFHLLYKQKWYKKKKAGAKEPRIKYRIPIEQRPDYINNRTEAWHFEADLIVSKKWYKGALLTLIDRKTRYSKIFKLKNKKSKNIMNLIAWVKEKLWIKSVTFDNWMEFAKHYLLNFIWIDTYFCNAYASWEKWWVENLNRIIRRFLPKKTIIDHVSEQKIRSINNIIINTPREILGFVSPNQVHFAKSNLNFN